MEPLYSQGNPSEAIIGSILVSEIPGLGQEITDPEMQILLT